MFPVYPVCMSATQEKHSDTCCCSEAFWNLPALAMRLQFITSIRRGILRYKRQREARAIEYIRQGDELPLQERLQELIDRMLNSM